MSETSKVEEVKQPIFPPGTVQLTKDRRSGRMILLTGPSGVGKTHLIGDLIEGFGRDKVLIASTERKLKTIEELDPWVYTIKYVDFPASALEKKSCKSDMMDLLDWLRGQDHQLDAFCVDSMMRYAWKLLIFLKDTASNAKGDNDTRKAYGLLGAKMKMFLDTIASTTDSTAGTKKPVHFIGTWGTGTDIDEETGRKMELPLVDGKMVQPIINFHWDDVLRLEKDERGEYLMYTAGIGRFDAKVSTRNKEVKEKLGKVVKGPNLFEYLKLFEGK